MAAQLRLKSKLKHSIESQLSAIATGQHGVEVAAQCVPRPSYLREIEAEGGDGAEQVV